MVGLVAAGIGEAGSVQIGENIGSMRLKTAVIVEKCSLYVTCVLAFLFWLWIQADIFRS